ncbi:MAG: Cdc6/Cdc18 family protein [Promethearchaeota archaeon]
MSDIIDKALGAKSIFKDETTLYPAYVPPKIPYRDNTITALAQSFRSIFDPSSPTIGVNIALIGPAGVGKTLTSRFVTQRLVEKARSEKVGLLESYTNCWTCRSKSAILQSILRDKFEVSMRGFGEEEGVDILLRRLESQNTHLIIILDEISVLPYEDIRGFIHLPEELGARYRLSFIMISRPTDWKVELAPHVSQRINDVIELNPYSEDELNTILSYRAELALRPGSYTPEIIEMISQIAHQTLNTRHGIEILYRAAKLADRYGEKVINPEMIREAKAHVYPELRSEVLESLEQQELLTVLAIARRLKHKNVSSTTVSQAYKNYKIACEEHGVKVRSESRWRGYLDKIVQLGLVAKTTINIGPPHGLRTRITIQDIPAEVLIERIESSLYKKENPD